MGSDHLFSLVGWTQQYVPQPHSIWYGSRPDSYLSMSEGWSESKCLSTGFELKYSLESLVKIASSHAFDATDPIEAMTYDVVKCRLAVTSHHGRISLYNIGRNGQSSSFFKGTY